MITVVGLGPGNAEYLTFRAQKIIEKSDWIVGAERQLATIRPHSAKEHLLDKKLMNLVVWLKENTHENITVLASGDPMLYGIGKFLSEQLGKEHVTVISGIGSMQYLFSQLKLDMNDVYLTSSHGKVPNFDFMLMHEKIALVTDEAIGPYQIAQEILKRGQTRSMAIGENLSYPNERITCLAPKAVEDRVYDMNVVVIYNER